MIQPPSPSWIDDGSSPMTAPTTHAVAATLNAEKRYGSAAGTRSFQKTDHSRAAYDCMSSTAAGSADRSPRTVFTVTGKNVRYAAMTATRIQSFGVQPAMLDVPEPDDDDRREREDRDRLRRDDVRHDAALEHARSAR